MTKTRLTKAMQVVLWYGEPNATSNAIGYAKHGSDANGNVIETHEHAGEFKEP